MCYSYIARNIIILKESHIESIYGTRTLHDKKKLRMQLRLHCGLREKGPGGVLVSYPCLSLPVAAPLEHGDELGLGERAAVVGVGLAEKPLVLIHTHSFSLQRRKETRR